MADIVSAPKPPVFYENDVEHRRQIAEYARQCGDRANAGYPRDGTEAMEAPMPLATYTVATLPTAADYTGCIIYVSDAGAGARFQGSHGGAWVNLG